MVAGDDETRGFCRSGDDETRGLCRSGDDETRGISLLAIAARRVALRQAHNATPYPGSLGSQSSPRAPLERKPAPGDYPLPRAHLGPHSMLAPSALNKRALHATRSGNILHSKGSVRVYPLEWSLEEWTGKTAPLDDDGYDAIAALEADEDMEFFYSSIDQSNGLQDH